MRRRALAVAVALAAVAAGCGDDAGRTIAPAGAPYRYKVPPGMRIRDDVQVVTGSEDARYLTAVALDREDLITVSSYRLPVAVESLDGATLRQQLDDSVTESLGARAHVSGPKQVATRTGTAWEYLLSGTRSPDGDPASLRIIYALKGRDEVVVMCRGAGRADALMRGCDRVVASLELPSSAA